MRDTGASLGEGPIGAIMNKRYFLIAFGLWAMVGTSLAAAPYEDTVIAQLKSQGYHGITVERTLLGRVKIMGLIEPGRREIILNPRTGEILRDLWLTGSGRADGPRIIQERDNSGNGGGDGDQGDDDDEDEDEDNSGSSVDDN